MDDCVRRELRDYEGHFIDQIFIDLSPLPQAIAYKRARCPGCAQLGCKVGCLVAEP